MKRDSSPPRRPLRAKLRELGLLSRAQEAGLPRFLILGSERSGARRLAQLLRHDPGCSLPESLGTQFFSSRHQWCDLDWYIRALGDDVHQIRGEWTSSYTLLPVKTIRLLNELVPELKLVFLLADPAVEAWHAWQEFRQADSEFRAESWAGADPLGQLRRWQSVFPAVQFFIGFEQDLRAEPEAFLEGLARFLDNDRGPALPEVFPAGLTASSAADDIPPSELALHREACRPRTEALVDHLQNQFGRNAPAGWTARTAIDLDARQVARLTQVFSSVVEREFDDIFLHNAVANEDGRSNASQRLESLCGFDLYLVNQRVAAVPAGQIVSGAGEIESNQALWADDLCSLRALVVRSRAAFGAASPVQNGNPPGFAAERLSVYGDVPIRLVQENYRGFNILNFRQQFWAIPQAAGAFDPSRLSDTAITNMVHAGQLLPARSMAGALAAVDNSLERRPPRESCGTAPGDGSDLSLEL